MSKPAEEPVQRVVFPLLAFERALKQLDFDSLKSILSAHGWDDSDFEILQPRIELKKKELALWLKATRYCDFESQSINALGKQLSPKGESFIVRLKGRRHTGGLHRQLADRQIGQAPGCSDL
ncbi:MAG: hypothetical protein K1X28_05425, partial [Parachlamydiales bacterium]|nr:hypothetical protein [Parachlamydiales bacterium]